MKGLLRRRPSPALVIACIALFVALAPAAYGTHLGALLLGHPNTANRQTSLSASVNGATPGGGKALQLTNTSTAAGAEGLGITVGTNKAPIRINANAGKAANLNADKLDGLDSTQLSPVSGDGRTADLNLSDSGRVLGAEITTAGSSSLLASATLQLNGVGDELVSCLLRFDGGTADSALHQTRIPNTGRPVDVTSLALVWAQAVGAGMHTVDLMCSGGGVIVDNAALTVSAHPL